MTTAAPTKDELDKLRESQQKLEAARQERAQLGVESRNFGAELAAAEAELAQLAREDPAQFDNEGQPRPKTRAAALKAKLDQAGSSRWPDVLAGADRRILELERQVARLTAENAVELARREFRGGEDDLAKVDTLAEQMLAALDSLQHRGHRLISVVASCGGRIDGRDISTDPRFEELRHLLTEHASFRPPRSRTLTPLVGESPAVVRGRGSGWVLAAHGSDSHAEEQPPKLEPNR